MHVTGEEMFDRGGGEYVYDGEGAPGYALQWGGGGQEGEVSDHHVGGPFRISTRNFISSETGMHFDPRSALDHSSLEGILD